MKSPQAILSDADGTLVNTLQLIRQGQYQTAKAYLLQQGVLERELPDYASYETILNKLVGQSARKLLEVTLREVYKDKPQLLKTIDFDAVYEMLNPIQDTLAMDCITAYDGLSPLLSYIGKNSLKLAIFTSGTSYHVLRNFGIALPDLRLDQAWRNTQLSHRENAKLLENAVIDRYQLSDFTIVTADDIQSDKPDPEGLNLAMHRLGVGPEESLVLGDHSIDMQSGVNADVLHRVGITHGFHDRKTLESAGATLVVDSLQELIDNFQG